MISRVNVLASRTGLGVFSLESFRADEEIAEIFGEIIEEPEYESDYCIDLGDVVLEAAPPFRYLNHSCEPNCELIVLEEEQEDGRVHQSVHIYAIRSIEAGEELTIDYAWETEHCVRCECGSSQCRGWIEK